MEWKVSTSDKTVTTDPVLLGRAVREIALNAQQSGKKAQAELAESPTGATLIIRELGTPEYPWPETPFTTLRAGRYGVGLYLASMIFRSLGLEVNREARGEDLETRVHLIGA